MAGYRFKSADTGMDCAFGFNDASSKDEATELARTHASIAFCSLPPSGVQNFIDGRVGPPESP